MKPAALLSRTLIALNGVDAGMTAILIISGITGELNPVMAILLKVNPLLFLAVKLAIMDVFAPFLGRVYRHKLFPWQLVALNLAYLMAIGFSLYCAMVKT